MNSLIKSESHWASVCFQTSSIPDTVYRKKRVTESRKHTLQCTFCIQCYQMYRTYTMVISGHLTQLDSP